METQTSRISHNPALPAEFFSEQAEEELQFTLRCRALGRGDCSMHESAFAPHVSACKVELAAGRCDEYQKEHPEEKENMRACDPTSICRDQIYGEALAVVQCLKTIPEPAFDAIKGVVVGAYEHVLKNVKKGSQVLNECDSKPMASPEALERARDCRRDLASDVPPLAALSDAELARIPAFDLVQRRKAYLESEARVAQFSSARRGLRPVVEADEGDEEGGGGDEGKGQSEVDRILNSRIKIKASVIASAARSWIESQGVRLACYDRAAAAELMCYGVFSVVDPTMAGLYTAKFLNRTKLRWIPKALLSPRKRLIRDYLEREIGSVAANERWIAMAERIDVPDGKSLFFEVENAKLKELNDTLKDKNLVTSLNNLHKEIFAKKMKALREKFPGQWEDYSDFKSARIGFHGEVTPELKEALETALRETHEEFLEYVKANRILRSEEVDGAAAWFQAGIGQTADQASQATRYNRRISGGPLVRSFDDPNLQANLSSTLQYAHDYRSQLISDLKGTDLLEVHGDGTTVLSRAVWDLLRKSGSEKEFYNQLKARFPNSNLKPETAAAMKTYIATIDDFSPSLRIAKRELANLDVAAHGGFSVDFAGLGAENLQATELALARAKNLDEVIAQARLEERKLTSVIDKRKANLQNMIKETLNKRSVPVKTVCSGDDCIILPEMALTAGDRKAVLEALAKSEDSSRMRLSFVSHSVKDSAARSQIAAHGETIEKLLRSDLEGKIPREILAKLMFGVDMQGEALGHGAVHLIVGQSKGEGLTSLQEQIIERSFKRAISAMNVELKGMSKPGAYGAGSLR